MGKKKKRQDRLGFCPQVFSPVGKDNIPQIDVIKIPTRFLWQKTRIIWKKIPFKLNSLDYHLHN